MLLQFLRIGRKLEIAKLQKVARNTKSCQKRAKHLVVSPKGDHFAFMPYNCINKKEIPAELSGEKMISSHVKINAIFTREEITGYIK